MIKASGSFKNDQMLKDIKRMMELSESSVEVGWFEDQGKHPTADMTYPELAHFHAVGGDDKTRVIPRDVLAVHLDMFEFGSNGEIIKAVENWLRDPSQTLPSKVLQRIGNAQLEHIKSLFGSAYLTQTEGNPDPLIDTGELRDHTEARVVNKDA